MVLMILDVCSLALEISCMEPVRRCMDSPASVMVRLASFIRVSVWLALSELRRVIEAISSRDEEVSSSEAACSEAPSAS